MSENQNARSAQPAEQFNFSQVFWNKTTLLFGMYWFFRWLWPSILPEALQTANFQIQTLACAAGGLVLTLFAAVRHAIDAEPEADRK